MDTVTVQPTERAAECDTTDEAIALGKRFPREINFVGDVKRCFSQAIVASLFVDDRLAIAVADGGWVVMSANERGGHPTTEFHSGGKPFDEDTRLPESIELRFKGDYEVRSVWHRAEILRTLCGRRLLGIASIPGGTLVYIEGRSGLLVSSQTNAETGRSFLFWDWNE